jgi:hypothetical protein
MPNGPFALRWDLRRSLSPFSLLRHALGSFQHYVAPSETQRARLIWRHSGALLVITQIQQRF